MIVTLTEYLELASDSNGTRMPLGQGRIGVHRFTADGESPKLYPGTRMVRIATDTPLTITMNGGEGELYMPGVEYIAVRGGEQLELRAA